jgi:hypothetical protein
LKVASGTASSADGGCHSPPAEAFIISIPQLNTAEEELSDGGEDFQWRAASHGTVGDPLQLAAQLASSVAAGPNPAINFTSSL